MLIAPKHASSSFHESTMKDSKLF